MDTLLTSRQNSLRHSTVHNAYAAVDKIRQWVFPALRHLLLVLVCACITLGAASCMLCKHEKTAEEQVAFQPDLSVIMAVQLFSSQYGLPYRFSVNCMITNRTMTVRILDRGEDFIGKAVVNNRFSSREPEFRLFDCIKTENSVPPEIVSLALLRGYERYSFSFTNGFSVYVDEDRDGYFIAVDDASLIPSNNYSTHIYRKNLMFGAGGR